MDIIASQAAWKQALDTLSPIRGGASALPILNCVLIQARESGLTLTRTDRERQLRTLLQVDEVTDPGEVAVDARKLAAIIAALPAGSSVRARQTAERLTLAVSLGGRVVSRFTLGTLPGEDYPLMDLEPEPDPEQAARIPPPVHLTLPGSRLAATLYATSFAAAKQDVRYYLNGLLFEWRDASLILVATDGHRLANIGLKADIDGNPGQAIVPAETVPILAKIGAAMGPAPVTLTLHRNRLAVAWHGGDLVSKLIDGKYPDWRRVVPPDRQSAAEWRLPVADLAAALGRVKILSHADFHGVALEVRADEPQTLYLSATNTERDEAEETVPLAELSAPGRWGFRIDYLLDALSHCPTPEIEIRLHDGITSTRLAPGTPSGDDDQENPEWVVMPMLL